MGTEQNALVEALVYRVRGDNASWTSCFVVVEQQELRCNLGSYCRAQGCIKDQSIVVYVYLLSAFLALHFVLAHVMSRRNRRRRTVRCIVTVQDEQQRHRGAGSEAQQEHEAEQ